MPFDAKASEVAGELAGFLEDWTAHVAPIRDESRAYGHGTREGGSQCQPANQSPADQRTAILAAHNWATDVNAGWFAEGLGRQVAQGLREELTQCAAVCIAWLESLPAE